MNRTNGKIAEQSKEKIAKALLVTMMQYNFREITITQIAQEAKLSRKTFYRLFNTKEDVLNYLFEGLYVECFTKIKALNLHHYWDVVQCYFDFWEEHKEMLDIFKKNNLLPVLFDGAYNYSYQIFEYVRSKEVAREFSNMLPYLLAYSVGGMHTMILKWVENDIQVPSVLLVEKLKEGFMSENI